MGLWWGTWRPLGLSWGTPSAKNTTTSESANGVRGPVCSEDRNWWGKKDTAFFHSSCLLKFDVENRESKTKSSSTLCPAVDLHQLCHEQGLCDKSISYVTCEPCLFSAGKDQTNMTTWLTLEEPRLDVNGISFINIDKITKWIFTRSYYTHTLHYLRRTIVTVIKIILIFLLLAITVIILSSFFFFSIFLFVKFVVFIIHSNFRYCYKCLIFRV